MICIYLYIILGIYIYVHICKYNNAEVIVAQYFIIYFIIWLLLMVNQMEYDDAFKLTNQILIN